MLSWKEREKASEGGKQDLGITIIQIGSGHEIRADHFQAIAAGAIRTQHAPRGFQCLLDHGQLAAVHLEIE